MPLSIQMTFRLSMIVFVVIVCGWRRTLMTIGGFSTISTFLSKWPSHWHDIETDYVGEWKLKRLRSRSRRHQFIVAMHANETSNTIVLSRRQAASDPQIIFINQRAIFSRARHSFHQIRPSPSASVLMFRSQKGDSMPSNWNIFQASSGSKMFGRHEDGDDKQEDDEEDDAS